MRFHLRDPMLLDKLIQATKTENYAPEEVDELVWECHNVHIYDISTSVNTLHMLVAACDNTDLSRLLHNWKVMNNLKLTIYHGSDMAVFLPGGIIHVHSQKDGEKVFHVFNSKEVEELIKYFQQG